jgi:hypothetical protein
MLDHFPVVFATAPLDSSMADFVLQSGRHQFLKEVLSSFQFYSSPLQNMENPHFDPCFGLTNKCTFMFWQTSIIDETTNDLISL